MTTKKTAIVFPGQGSQRLGMAKDFVAEFSESREIFELASDVMGHDMQDLCFSDQIRLDQTEFMQPAILTAEIAMFVVFEKHLKNKPACFGGHSMGEYTALVAAGAIPFQDAISIVKGRGALMLHAVPEGSGTMVALIHDGIENSNFESLVLESGAEVANFNSPNQVVITGPNEAIDDSCARLQAAFPEMRIVRLDIRLPFHGSLMKSVEPELEKYLRVFEPNINFSKADIVVSNLLGGFHSGEYLIQNLVRQISGCVQWGKNIKTLAACSDEVVEIGPNRVLGRFFKESGVSACSIINLRSFNKYLEAASGT